MTRRLVAPWLLIALAACGTPGQNVPVDVPEAKVPEPSEQVALDVGRLLSADAAVSAEAERRLLVLDEKGREALRRFARTIPGERDPRWWNVLDEHRMLPELSGQDRLSFLLWKSRRPDGLAAMKAQSALQEMARAQPDVLIAWLERARRAPPGDPSAAGVAEVGVALAVARVDAAVPPLLGLYREARSADDRRAVAEALALLAGEELRPRAQGTPAEIAHDAAAIEAWHRARATAGAAREDGRG